MRENHSRAKVMLVVPTLGRRMRYLRQTLESIVGQDVPADIVVVGPHENSDLVRLAREFGACTLPDPGSQAAAINFGIREFASSHEFVGWLNDDDVLEAGALKAVVGALDARPDAAVAFGACRYVDGLGRTLLVSRAGPWATRVLPWGPDLIPQPGMLVRTTAWRDVGGLDESFRLAFDLDLLLRVRKVGALIDVGVVVSQFRWHPDSLTVEGRSANLAESERAKRQAMSQVARKLAWTWEWGVRCAIRIAAAEVNRRARKLATK